MDLLGFEQQISGVGSDRSANCATTIAHSVIAKYFFLQKREKGFLLFWQVVLFSFLASVGRLFVISAFLCLSPHFCWFMTNIIHFILPGLAWPSLGWSGLVWFAWIACLESRDRRQSVQGSRIDFKNHISQKHKDKIISKYSFPESVNVSPNSRLDQDWIIKTNEFETN